MSSFHFLFCRGENLNVMQSTPLERSSAAEEKGALPMISTLGTGEVTGNMAILVGIIYPHL